MSISLLSICGIGLILNVIEITVLIYHKKTKIPFDISLISLALADFFTSLLPIVVHLLYLRSLLYRIILGHIFYASCLTSSFMLGYIAFQRLIAVLYPHKYPTLMTRRRCIVAICLMWLVSAGLILPIFLRSVTFYGVIYVHILVMAGIVMLCSYAMLNCQLLKQRNRSELIQSWNGHRQILVYSTILTAVFFVSTLPYAISIALLPHAVSYAIISYHIYMSHVIFNPILYFTVKYFNVKRLCSQIIDTEKAIQPVNMRHVPAAGRT